MNTSFSAPTAFAFQMNGAPGPLTRIDGCEYLYFAGTSYFQLHNHPAVVQAAIKALEHYGTCSATSRTITGNTPLLQALEQALASFFGSDDAVYLPSGYLSNLAGLLALKELQAFDTMFIDSQAHYSLADAARALGVTMYAFEHTDAKHLHYLLQHKLSSGERPAILTDGLFPVWGRLAPLPHYLALAESYNGVLWIDDAHSVGIIGSHGRGSAEQFGLQSERLYQVATLSKAFGAYGGFVVGNAAFIHAIKTGNVVTGSTSPMAAATAAALRGIQLVQEQPQLRQQLTNNAQYLKERLATLGIATAADNIPIASFVLPGFGRMADLHAYLMQQGIYIQHTHYYGAGPEGVLRIVVSAAHTRDHIDELCHALAHGLQML